MHFNKLVLLVIIFLNIEGWTQNPQWNSSLVLDPNPSSFLSDWQREIRVGTFTLTYTGNTPVDFYGKLKLIHHSLGEILSAKSSTLSFLGAGIQVYNGPDLVSWKDITYSQALKERVFRTGRLIEGNYDLKVEIYSLNHQLLNSAEGNFSITYSAPPQLILPENQTTITTDLPNFQWTPVIAAAGHSVQYKLKIVEMLYGQTPNQAMAANQVHFTDSISNSTFFAYPDGALPLEFGKQYVWQIIVTDETGNIITNNDGKSELWTFSFFPPTIVNQYPHQNIQLISNRAFLTDIHGLTILEEQNTYTLNGTATLLIKLPGSNEDFTKSLSITNLVLTKSGSYLPPTPTSGNFSLDILESDFPQSFTKNWFNPTKINYDASTGMTLKGGIKLPNLLAPIQALGEFEITQAGFAGVLSSTGTQLYSFTNGNVSSVLDAVRLEIQQTGVKLFLGGSISMFNNAHTLLLEELTLNEDEKITRTLNEGISQTLNVVPSQPSVNITLNNLTGNYEFDLAANSFSFNFKYGSSFSFSTNYQATFNQNFILESSSISGINVVPNPQTSSMQFNLGPLQLSASNIRLNALTYENMNWDFEILFNAVTTLPGLGNISLPSINDISLTQNGFIINAYSTGQLPATTIGKKQLISGVELDFQQFSFPQITADWQTIISGNLQDFSATINANLYLPELQGGASQSLKNLNLPFTAAISNSNFAAIIPTSVFSGSGHTYSLSNNSTFYVKEISGSLNGIFTGVSLSLTPELKVKGALNFPSAFNFSGGNSVVNLNSDFNFDPKGIIIGSEEGLSLNCTMNIGEFSASLINSNLVFAVLGDSQKVTLNGNTNISLAGPNNTTTSVSALLEFDIVNNYIKSFEGQITSPFLLNFPKTNSVLTLQISSATLSQEGIHINGRNSFLFGNNSTMGVTANNVIYSLNQSKISEGTIIFDNSFALKLKFLQGEKLYSAVELNSEIQSNESSTLIINLPSSISLTQDGLITSGSSTGNRIKYGGYDIVADAVFSPDFQMGGSPFGVTGGSVNFRYNGLDVAELGQQGFLPDFSSLTFATLPEDLPLPNVTIGYLKIKEGDTYLVNHENSEQGMHLWTTPGQTVKLFLPALKLGRDEVPSLDISFDVYYDLTKYDLKSGSINVQIPSTASEMFDLTATGLPLIVRSISYLSDDGELYKYKLSSVIKVFDALVENNPIDLTLKNDGTLSGIYSISNLDNEFSLVDGSQKIKMKLNELNGTINSLTLPVFNPSFDFDFNGEIQVNFGDDNLLVLEGSFELSNNGISIGTFSAPAASNVSIVTTSTNISVQDPTLDSLNFSSTDGWNFLLKFSGGYTFPQIGNLQLPQVNNFELRKNGLTLPEINLNNLSASAYSISGSALKVLNFRTAGITFNWFDENQSVNAFDTLSYLFDFEATISGLVPRFPQSLRDIKLYSTNTLLKNGIISGEFAYVDFVDSITVSAAGGNQLFFSGIDGNLGVDSLGAQAFFAHLNGGIILPDTFQCNGFNGIINLSFNINPSGFLKGKISDISPSCPLKLGPGVYTISNAEVDYEFSDNADQLIFATTGVFEYPNANGTSTNSVNGNLTLDIINFEIVSGSIALNSSFRWYYPMDNEFLTFNSDANSATISSEGFKINGSGFLILPSNTAPVNFNNFLLGVQNNNLISGAAKINSEMAYRITIQSGALTWLPVAANDVIPSADSNAIVMRVPAETIISTEGLAVSGTTQSLLKYNGRQFEGVETIFQNNFKLNLSPTAVAEGFVLFKKNDDTLGTLTTSGFLPGKIFMTPDIPQFLVLENENRAKLFLYEGNAPVVQVEPASNGFRVRTIDNKKVRIEIGGLKYGNNPAPVFPIALDVIVDNSFSRIISGSIIIQGSAQTPLINLKNRGVPFDLTKITINPTANGYSILAGGKIVFPASISEVDVSFDSLSITQNGLAGEKNFGVYSTTYNLNAPIVDTARLGSVSSISVTGLQINLNQPAATSPIQFSGTISTVLFKDTTNVNTPLFYYAEWNQQDKKFIFNYNLDHISNAVLPIGKHLLTLGELNGNPKLEMKISDSEFEIIARGTYSISNFQDFQVPITINVSKDIINFPNIDFQSPYPSFWAHQCKFEYNKMRLALENNSDIKIWVDGRVTFLTETINFENLVINKDGQISLSEPRLLNNTNAYIVSSAYKLVIYYVVLSNDFLLVDGFIGLLGSTQLDSVRRYVTFKIDREGNVSKRPDRLKIGNNPAHLATTIKLSQRKWQLVISNRVSGIADSSAFRFKVESFIMDPVYFAFTLDFETINNCNMETVIDFYKIKENEKKLFLKLGTNSNAVEPGLTMSRGSGLELGTLTYPLTDTLKLDDFENMELKVWAIGIDVTDDWDFQLKFSGSMGLKRGSVSGGLEVNNLIFSGRERWFINVPTAIAGGYFRIANKFSLTVNKVQYSTEPSVVYVRGGTNGELIAINVNKYFSFGASLSVDSLFTVGVDTLLLFKGTNDRFGMVITNANLEIENVLKLRVDLQYFSLGNGFIFEIAGNAKIKERYEFTIVGNLRTIDNTLSMGLFIAVSGFAPKPIGPGTFLVGAGGGFFWNPSTSDRATVLANLGMVNNAASKVNSTSAKFMVMIYGKIDFINTNFVRADVLLTVTNTYLSIDGHAIIFNKTNEMEGDLNLAIGWDDFFIDGNISLKLKAKVIKGSGTLRFYVYSEEVWGVLGDLSLFLGTDTVKGKPGTLEARGKLIIGPKGFFVQAQLQGTYKIKVISIEAGIVAQIWYIKDVSWGAYLKAYCHISVPVVASVGATLELCLMSNDNFILYGALTGYVQTVVWSGNVRAWVKYHEGWDAGLGSDKEMDNLLSEVTAEANRLLEVSNSAQQTLNSYQASMLTLTESQLNQAFDNMYTAALNSASSDPQKRLAARTTIFFVGLGGLFSNPFDNSNQQNYYNTINDGIIYTLQNFYLADWSTKNTSIILSRKNELNDKINSYNSKRTSLSSTLSSAIQNNLAAIQEVSYSPMSNPITSADTALSATMSIQNGQNVMVASSNPNFNINEGTNNSNISNMEAAEGDFERYRNAIDTRILELESRIQVVRNTFATVSQNQTSYLSLGLEYKNILEKIDNFYKDFISEVHKEGKFASDKYAQNLNNNPLKTFITRSDFDVIFNSVKNSDAEFINRVRDGAGTAYAVLTMFSETDTSQWSPKITQYRSYLENVNDFETLKSTWKENFGNAFFNVINNGYVTLIDSAKSKLLNLILECKSRLAEVEDMHEQITLVADSLYRVNTSLTEKFYDLLDKYEYLLSTNADSTRYASMISNIRSKKNAIISDLTIPNITTLNSTVTSYNYHNDVNVNWGVNNPNNISEYAIKIMRHGQTFDGRFQSLGSATNVSRKLMPSIPLTISNTAQFTEDAKIYIRARSKGGYTIQKNKQVQLTYKLFDYASGLQVPIVTQVTTGLPTDNTPPEIIELKINGENSISTYNKEYFQIFDMNNLQASFRGADQQSGIIKYEFGWKQTNFSNSQSVPNIDNAGITYNNCEGMTSIEMTNPQFQNRKWIMVSVRVTNGAGLITIKTLPAWVDTNQAFLRLDEVEITSFVSGNALRFKVKINKSQSPRDCNSFDIMIHEIESNAQYAQSNNNRSWNQIKNGQESINHNIRAAQLCNVKIIGKKNNVIQGTFQTTIQAAKFNRKENVGDVKSTVLNTTYGEVKFVTHNAQLIKQYIIDVRKDNSNSTPVFSKIVTVPSTDTSTGFPFYQTYYAYRGLSWDQSSFGDGRYYVTVTSFSYDSIYGNTKVLKSYLFDSSPPTKPLVTPVPKINDEKNIEFTFYTASADATSGIRGYDIAIGSAANNTSIKGWALDINDSTITNNSKRTITYTQNQVSGKKYFHIRAVNKVGLTSQTHTVEVETDFEDPTVTSSRIDLQWLGGWDKEVHNFWATYELNDNTGIQKVEYWMYYGSTQMKTGSKNFPAFPKKVTQADLEMKYNLGGKDDGTVKVKIKITDKHGRTKEIELSKSF